MLYIVSKSHSAYRQMEFHESTRACLLPQQIKHRLISFLYSEIVFKEKHGVCTMEPYAGVGSMQTHLMLTRTHVPWTIGYSDHDVFLASDMGSMIYRCKK